MTFPGQTHSQGIQRSSVRVFIIPILVQGLLGTRKDIVIFQHGWHHITLAHAFGERSAVGHRSMRSRTFKDPERGLRACLHVLQDVSGRLASLEALGQLHGHCEWLVGPNAGNRFRIMQMY